MKKTYAEKLQDPRWQKKRLEVLNKAGFKCELCKSEEDTLHVHHKSYKRGKQPWEYELGNFQSLCKYCHGLTEELKGIGYIPFLITRSPSFTIPQENFYVYGSNPLTDATSVFFYSRNLDTDQVRHQGGVREETIHLMSKNLKKAKR